MLSECGTYLINYFGILCTVYILLRFVACSRCSSIFCIQLTGRELCSRHLPTHLCSTIIDIIEGSLEVKLPTLWRDEKAVSREKSQKRKDQKKEDAGARKDREVAKHCVFSWFCGSGGLESRLAKAAGAETSGEVRDKKLQAVVARSTFGSKMC